MKINMKQFPKHQFDVEVLEQTEKGLEKNNFPPNLISSQFSTLLFYMISVVSITWL